MKMDVIIRDNHRV